MSAHMRRCCSSRCGRLNGVRASETMREVPQRPWGWP
jgi:hypothetical protein